MKDKAFPILYIFIGLYCGFLLGAFLDRDLSAAIGKGLYASAILIFALFWRRIDQRSHQRHLAAWQKLRRKGKWYFVLTRYVLLRGMILLVLFGPPLYFSAPSEPAAGKIFVLIAGVLTVMMLYLGHIEWQYCQQDYEILAVRQAAEEATRDATLYN